MNLSKTSKLPVIKEIIDNFDYIKGTTFFKYPSTAKIQRKGNSQMRSEKLL
jgi:hypothetical protein